MNEEYTYEYILNRMLNNISDDIDKREGSVIYNAIAPCAMELVEMYKKLDATINQAFPQTATGKYLDNLTKEFGIERKEATFAVKKGTFYNSSNSLMNIPIGSRFSINSIIYFASTKISNGVYQMQCETAGKIGNNQSGNLLTIDYIANLASAVLSDLLIPAKDEETDEELRARFLKTIDDAPFGGNIADYREKIKEIGGIGAVKVIPTWNGGGTVKIIILNDALERASSVLISKVQEAIGQNGSGIAPIGHTVTTVTASNLNIAVTGNITLDPDVELSTIQENIESAIRDYFFEVKENWENTTSLTIRIAYVESRILDVEGVADISNLKLNNYASNVTIPNEKIPYLSGVTLNA